MTLTGQRLPGPLRRIDASPLTVVRRSVGLAAIMTLALGGCMGSPMGPMHPGMHQPDGNDPQALSPVVGAPELLIVATDFRFDPDELSIRTGQTVNLTLDNRGRLYHDLTIERLGFVITADGGERSGGALAAPNPGRYRFECSVPGHAEAGMTGTLMVE